MWRCHTIAVALSVALSKYEHDLADKNIHGNEKCPDIGVWSRHRSMARFSISPLQLKQSTPITLAPIASVIAAFSPRFLVLCCND